MVPSTYSNSISWVITGGRMEENRLQLEASLATKDLEKITGIRLNLERDIIT
jgi:hypothetical protein